MRGRINRFTIAWVCTFGLLIGACDTAPEKGYQFELLDAQSTGLRFENTPEQTLEFNVFDYMYFFNGGGVGAGDFNNDGKIDLYFTANLQENKLFLNQGDLRFEDVTEAAGVKGDANGWTTGVSVIDINNDGLLDIYVSQVGDFQAFATTNQLFVCIEIKDGVPIYEDQALQYDLDLVGFSTQAAFFDYDLDGDLDMFQLNHTLHQNGTFGRRNSFLDQSHPTSGDKLLRNDNGRFVDVTQNAGILSNVVGYGLGLRVSDINFDGWPDIYIGNDFHENDYLYINKGDGTFKEDIVNQLMHTSRFSMGVDVADVNNDGLNDVISLDMQPYNPEILKSSLGEDPYDVFYFKTNFGYQEQYARNNLQINNGDDTFTEVGMFSGIHATDWSWAPLIFDFDNDGHKDIFISNGIPRRMNNIDYLNFMNSSPEQQEKTETGEVDEKDLAIIEQMPRIKVPNRFYANTRDLRFTDQSHRIKNDQDSYSNGAVYVDLDNDGDLDVVVNNIEDAPFLYENLNNELPESNTALRLRLQGSTENLHAIGARLLVEKTNGERLIAEHYPVKGFQSSALSLLEIGIGDPSSVENVYLIWPDQSYERIESPRYDQVMELKWRNGLPAFDFKSFQKTFSTRLDFADVTATTELDFSHEENTSFVEFNREPLIPYMVSAEGPALAVGDINGDGLEDLFFGGAKRKRAAFYYQTQDGKFVHNQQIAIANDSIYEDVDAVFVDIDNDNDLDLIVASGGNEYWAPSPYLQQRLYLNDGNGNFERKEQAFGNALLTAAFVAVADVNGDSRPDVFFGARAVPREFGATPKSYLFLNEGEGQFTEATANMSESLADVGLLREGEWTDIDQDGDQDLLLATDWDYVKLFENTEGKLVERAISSSRGWWNFVRSADFDGDGDLDILVGNIGMNNRFGATSETPVKMYFDDFDNDGKKEQFLTYFVNGQEVPFHTHAELTKRMVSLKKRYIYANDFAKASVEDLFGKEALQAAKSMSVDNTASVLLINQGDGTFVEQRLPDALQYSTLQTAVVGDFNGDGSTETFLAGNFYEVNIEMGRYDSNYGNVLYVNGQGEMTAESLGSLKVKGQVRKAAEITINGQKCLILAKNNDVAQILKAAPINP